MEWIWASQAFLLAFVIALAATLWRVHRRLAEVLSEDRVTAGLNVLESRLLDWDSESLGRKEAMDLQLQALQKICEKAKVIFDRERAFAGSQVTSIEESELKSLVGDGLLADETQSIPTLQQVEQTKKRLKQEMALDLRSLLRDQLA